jgi:hypothetical protein
MPHNVDEVSDRRSAAVTSRCAAESRVICRHSRQHAFSRLSPDKCSTIFVNCVCSNPKSFLPSNWPVLLQCMWKSWCPNSILVSSFKSKCSPTSTSGILRLKLSSSDRYLSSLRNDCAMVKTVRWSLASWRGKSGLEPRRVSVGLLVDKMAVRFLPKYFCFPLSVLFHQSSTYIPFTYHRLQIVLQIASLSLHYTGGLRCIFMPWQCRKLKWELTPAINY